MDDTDGWDGDALEKALRAADLRVLLMCLVQLTGDESWLEPPFRPARDVRLVPDPAAGLPPEVQERIRTAAHELLDGGVPPLAIVDPGDDLTLRMMRVCLGEEVPPEYAPMMREEMGFAPREPRVPVPEDPSALAALDVLVVGAGISGLALGAGLSRLGVPYTIVEKNEEVGGTWWENRYPGCGVDTPNHAYSFSFGSRNPWSRYFSRRDEIEDYLIRCADEFAVRPHVRFGTEVVGAAWDDADARWTVTVRTAGGVTEALSAAVLVSAIGQLNTPSVPSIPGADTFDGPLFHPARWPDGLDVRGRDIAVIGTGATAMQLVPTIAPTAGSVAVYQRTPQWARPIDHYLDEIGTGERWLLEHLPCYTAWFRFAMFWRYGDGLLPTLRRDPDWPHPERSMNRRNDRHREQLTDFIRAELAGRPDLVERCLPSYPPFGKRILIDNRWYRTLLRPNVELVTDPIDHVEPDAVVTADGVRRRADVVVLATGFDVTHLTARLHVRGRGGVDLADAWAGDNPTAHLGLTVPGFPNLFCMLGPGTGLAHGGSAIFQSECQARYITAALLKMAGEGIRALDVKREVHDDYVARMDAEHAQLVWTHPGVSPYYRNASGRVVSVMPWRLVDYWQMTLDPDLDEFVISR